VSCLTSDDARVRYDDVQFADAAAAWKRKCDVQAANSTVRRRTQRTITSHVSNRSGLIKSRRFAHLTL